MGLIAAKKPKPFCTPSHCSVQMRLVIRYVSSNKNLLLQKLTAFSQVAWKTSDSLSCISLRRKWNIGWKSP